MYEALMMLVRATIGFALVLGGWMLFLSFVREQKGCQGVTGQGVTNDDDEDPLSHMPGGCAGCSNAAKCQRRKAQQQHHEFV